MGASLAAIGAGLLRDSFGEYGIAGIAAAALCLAAVASMGIARGRRPLPA